MRRTVWALSICAALVGSSLAAAEASHPTQICVDLGADERYGTSNDDIIDTQQVSVGTSDAGHPPEQEGCVVEEGSDFGGTQIDFEVTGVADPDDSDSPQTPDMSCTVQAGFYSCFVEVPPSGGGNQTVRAWIDFDLDNATVEADLIEGYDEAAVPGNSPEPDGTDVSYWTWTHADPPPDMCGSDDVCWGRVTIGYEAKDKQFYGRIARENGSCGTGTVTLRKKRPGPDRKVAEALVSGLRWEVVLDRRVGGRFYAVLSKTHTWTFYSDWPEYRCEGDRSRVLEIG